MRLICLHYTTLPRIGGLELASYGLALAAARRPGWKSLLLTGTPGSSADIAEARRHYIPEVSTEHSINRIIYAALSCGRQHQSLEPMAQSLLESLEHIVMADDLLVSFNVLSVHYNPALSLALRRLAALRQDFKHLTWVFDVNVDFFQHLTVRSTFPWAELRQPCPGVIYSACSAPVADTFADVSGLSRSAVRVIPAGIDIALCLGLRGEIAALWRSRLSEAWPLLFMPARIASRKNIIAAVMMLPHLLALLPNAHLVVAGALSPHDVRSPQRLSELCQLRTRLGLKDALTILSADTNSQTGHAYEDCMSMMTLSDAVLITSVQEGFLIPALEAALHRIPIYAPSLESLTSAVGDLVDFFPPNLGSAELATWLYDHLLGSVSLRHQVVRSRHTWDTIFERHFVPLVSETYDSRHSV